MKERERERERVATRVFKLKFFREEGSLISKLLIRMNVLVKRLRNWIVSALL